jgi:nucleotide-binding universal stress UspA family protein
LNSPWRFKKKGENDLIELPDRTQTKKETVSKPGFNLSNIVVAVDLSPYSEKTAAYAANLAKNLNATLTLVHVFAPEPITEFASVQAQGAFGEDRRRTVGKLAALIEKVRQIGVECGDDFRVGDPAEEVVFAARSANAGLIITACPRPGFSGRSFEMASRDQDPASGQLSGPGLQRGNGEITRLVRPGEY